MSIKFCPGCGSTIGQIAEVGRFGCGFCYDYFKNYVEKVIFKSQNFNLKHVGKKPLHPPSNITGEKQLLVLNEKLKEAVAKEDYEKAALIKEIIQEYRKPFLPPN